MLDLDVELVKTFLGSAGRYKIETFASHNGGRNKIFERYKRFLFFKFYPKLEPGATIFVPTKLERKDKMTVQEIIGITTSFATLAFIINSFIK